MKTTDHLRVALLLQDAPVTRLGGVESVALCQVNQLAEIRGVVHHLLRHATHIHAGASDAVLLDNSHLLSVSRCSLRARQTTFPLPSTVLSYPIRLQSQSNHKSSVPYFNKV